MSPALDVHVTRDPDAPLVRVAGPFALPERIWATITPDDASVPVCRLEVVVEHGRPVCNGLRLERRPGGPPVTGTELRAVPVAEYVRRAADELLRELVATENPDGPVTLTDPQFGTVPVNSERFDDQHVAIRVVGLTLTKAYRATTRAPRKRGPITDDVLREVAAVYRAASFAGPAPTNAVRDQMGVSRATAGRWVAMARERGLLGKASPGVAGESEPLPGNGR